MSCVVEEKINLKKELSIVIGRDYRGNLSYYPSFRNIHKNHILHKTFSPSGVNNKIEDEGNFLPSNNSSRAPPPVEI